MFPTPEPSRKPPLAKKHAWQTSLSSEARIVHVRHPFDAGTLETLTRRLAEGRDSYGAQALSAPEPTMIVTAAPPFDPVGAVVAGPGAPVPFPGCTPGLPSEPVMTDGVRKVGLLDAPKGFSRRA
jgi:hypothetical protein